MLLLGIPGVSWWRSHHPIQPRLHRSSTWGSQLPHSTVYPFAANDRENRRFQLFAANGAAVYEDCRVVGLSSGQRAIDVGCGPIGALAQLADVVGAEGLAVGVDRNGHALRAAADFAAERGLKQIRLIEADINRLTPEDLAELAPFDLLYARCVLFWQPDPVETVGRLARLVRPGGHIVCWDTIENADYPRGEPDVPALRECLRLTSEVCRRRRGTPDVGLRYPLICSQVGLEPLRLEHVVQAPDPVRACDFARDALINERQSLVDDGIASGHDVDELIASLQKDRTRQFDYYFGYVRAHLVARVRADAGWRAC